MTLKRRWVVQDVVIGRVLGFVGSLIGGLGAAPALGDPVADQLAVIAAASRDNAARIKTLQLSGMITFSGKMVEGQWDPLVGQVYNSQTREFSVWKDALNLRSDVTADREFDPQTHEVRYNLPYGEHITSVGKLDMDALRREYGTTVSTTRTLVIPDQTYRYQPEAGLLYMNGLDAQSLSDEPQVRLALNRTADRTTSAEYLDWCAERAKDGSAALALTPLEGGRYRLHMEREITGPPNGPKHQRDVDAVFDLDQGGNLVSYVAQVDGQVVQTGAYEYMKANDAWILASATTVEQMALDGSPGLAMVCQVDPASVRINVPIDHDVFTFDGLRVRRGTYVSDQKTGEEYLYDDMPLHLKIALAAAREREGSASAEVAQSAPPAGRPAPDPRLGRAPAALVGIPPIPRGAGSATDATPVNRESSPDTGTDASPSDSETTQSRPTTPVQTTKAAQVVEVRAPAEPSATRPAPEVKSAQLDEPMVPLKAPGRLIPPSIAGTAAIVGAVSIVALGIVMGKKWRRRVATLRGRP